MQERWLTVMKGKRAIVVERIIDDSKSLWRLSLRSNPEVQESWLMKMKENEQWWWKKSLMAPSHFGDCHWGAVPICKKSIYGDEGKWVTMVERISMTPSHSSDCHWGAAQPIRIRLRGYMIHRSNCGIGKKTWKKPHWAELANYTDQIIRDTRHKRTTESRM